MLDDVELSIVPFPKQLSEALTRPLSSRAPEAPAGDSQFLEELKAQNRVKWRGQAIIYTKTQWHRKCLDKNMSADEAEQDFQRAKADTNRYHSITHNGEEAVAEVGPSMVLADTSQVWTRGLDLTRKAIEQGSEEQSKAYDRVLSLARTDVVPDPGWQPFGSRLLRDPGQLPIEIYSV